MNEKIREAHLKRKAIVYLRQSTMTQVTHNIESQHLQRAMKTRLQSLGWSSDRIITIEDDLGCSASGTAIRKGFERMVTDVCLGNVGAVSARELSRFARNNTQWHHLIEMCAVVDTLLIDAETVFDPHLSNDRLLLGLKGNLHVYELDILRQRGLEARKQKASRGELVNNVPAGFIKTEDGKIQKDPNRRVQNAIGRVFDKMLELGSARQVLFWHKEHDILLPVTRTNGRGWEVTWKIATDSIVRRILGNPVYAGVYAWGKRGVHNEVQQGKIVKSVRARDLDNFEVLIPDNHEGYISFATYKEIRCMMEKNNFNKNGTGHGAAREGEAILNGLIRCGHCGRKMHVGYSGSPRMIRYTCNGTSLDGAKLSCLSLGGKGIEESVAKELLRVVEPAALEAARIAFQQSQDKHTAIIDALTLELQGARHQVDLARRQYDAVDPANRLVADELESRWNTALEKVAAVEDKIQKTREIEHNELLYDENQLLTLAKDLKKVWNNPTTDNRLKKRIARTLIEDILIKENDHDTMLEVTIHWKGGVHTTINVRRRKRGEHGTSTSLDIVNAVRVLSLVNNDTSIAQLLNRNHLKTGKGNPWTRGRVKDLRHWHKIATHDNDIQQRDGWMTLKHAAAYLETSPKTLRIATESGKVKALHPLPFGNWIYQKKDLDRSAVKTYFMNCKKGCRRPTIPDSKQQTLMITEG